MRRRLSLLLTLAAWLLATGSQWDLVQAFAWGRMLVNYSRSMPLLQAAQKTFGGEMCEICRAVAAAKARQEADGAKSPDGKLPGKLVLAGAPPALCFFQAAPECVGLAPAVPAPPSAERSAPPSPPPRALA